MAESAVLYVGLVAEFASWCLRLKAKCAVQILVDRS